MAEGSVLFPVPDYVDGGDHDYHDDRDYRLTLWWLYGRGGVVFAVPDNDDGVDLTMTLTMLQIAMLDDGDGSDDWWQWL